MLTSIGSLPDWLSGNAPGALVAIVAVIAYLRVAGRVRLERERLASALENMTQGLCMFDGSTRIVVLNRRFLDMYNLSPEVVKPGCTLRPLIEHRKESGLFTGGVEKYCRKIVDNVAQGKTTTYQMQATDGRIVQVVNHLKPDGGWVVTHEDVIEQRRPENEHNSMAALEERRASLESAISAFRERIDKLLRTVGQSAQAMKSTAANLSASSAETSQHAESAVASSGDSSASVKTAATATDELANSITEISRRVGQTNNVVQMAVSEARATNDEIATLAQSA